MYVWLALVPIIGVIFGRIKDRSEKDMFFKLVFQITLNLFDGTEMLLVIPEVNDLGIPKRCEEAIITFVCISFMLSHFQLEENKISDKSIDK